jgi:hypothetical protein
LIKNGHRNFLPNCVIQDAKMASNFIQKQITDYRKNHLECTRRAAGRTEGSENGVFTSILDRKFISSTRGNKVSTREDELCSSSTWN